MSYETHTMECLLFFGVTSHIQGANVDTSNAKISTIHRHDVSIEMLHAEFAILCVTREAFFKVYVHNEHYF